LKPERWGSQLVEEEKFQGEKDCDRRNYDDDDDDDNNKNNAIDLTLELALYAP
jgi:hypothetical protein